VDQYFERFSRYSLKTPYERAKAFSFARPVGEAEEKQRWEEFKHWEDNDPEKFRDIMFIFNFFEELGGVYKRGAVDRRVVNEYLGRFALAFWEKLDWFISRIRIDQSPTHFEDWGAMCKAVERALNRKKQLREKDEKRKGDQQQKRQPPRPQRPGTPTDM
jgi:hypothetical protein